jgi:hypothetical protein
MKTLILTASIATSSLMMQAQSNEFLFKAMVVSGSVIKKSTTTEIPASTGQRFAATDAIIIQNKGYIGLLHKNGKTVEIKEPGTYSVKEVADRLLAESKESVGSKYATFVFNQLTKSDDNDLNKNHRQYMEVTGSVERSGSSGMIKLNAPITSDVMHNKITVSWNKHKDADGYVVTLTNFYNETVASVETKGESAEINLDDIQTKSNKGYLLTVRAANNPKIKSAQHLLKPLDKDKEQSIKAEISNIGSDAQTSIDLVALGSFFEDNHLYYDALKAYKLAASKSPNEPAFAELYNDMLKRIENNYAMAK